MKLVLLSAKKRTDFSGQIFTPPPKKKSHMPKLVRYTYLVPTCQGTWHLYLRPHVKYGVHAFGAPVVTDAKFHENRSRNKVRVEVNLPAYARCD